MSTYTPIATQTLGSAASSVTFSSLPQNYTDLVLVINGKYTTTEDSSPSIRFNGDTSSSYSDTILNGDGSNATSSRETNITSATVASMSGEQSTSIINIMNYANGTTYKTVISRANASTRVRAYAALWRKTDPITQIEILRNTTNNFQTGTTFTIYGVAAGNSSAKASGGNIVTTDGTYWYHTFTSSGTFIPSQALTCDYLVVAGGGGGGKWGPGGGGGAGGYRTSIGGSALSLSANTVYQAIIGAGGNSATNGNNSIFSTITSTGGGRGAGDNSLNLAANSGGSGGGGSGEGGGTTAGAGNAGSYSPVEGYSGGTGRDTSGSRGGGGGGGSSASGTSANSGAGGGGGNGTANSISGTSITYAGGGGGSHQTGSAGTGGTGGGGAGVTSSSATPNPGTVNTGGGGGGGGITGGAGGSGIIIVRYAV